MPPPPCPAAPAWPAHRPSRPPPLPATPPPDPPHQARTRPVPGPHQAGPHRTAPAPGGVLYSPSISLDISIMLGIVSNRSQEEATIMASTATKELQNGFLSTTRQGQ